MDMNNTDMAISLQQNEVLQMQADQQRSRIKTKKKNCHGNRKLHHFKRKCRSRGMTEEQITELINTRNNNNNNNSANGIVNNSILLNNNKIKNKKKKIQQEKQFNKRKRSDRNNQDNSNTTIRSMSQLSISPQLPLPKTIKTNKEQHYMASINQDSIVSSKYLQMPKKLLLHSLRLQLTHPMKKKKEKSFILSRLKLLDQQFCIGMDQYLYPSYFADGSHYKIWPDDLIKMTQTANYDHIEDFLKDYLIQLQQKFDQCTTQLITQALSCPKSMELSFIESQFKEFVRLHHLNLTRKINFQINKFKNQKREKELFQQLSSYPLTNEQQQTIQHLCHLRQQQLEKFEEMTKLEVRILCRILPKSINELDQFISSNQFLPLCNSNSSDDNNNSLYEMIKKHQKSIQNYKRQILAKNLEEYESTIEQNEFLYQEELFNFESELSNGEENDQSKNNLLNCLYKYLNCQTMSKIREIRFNETIFRHKLLHPCHRRSLLTTNNNTISIYPEAIIEIFEKVFTKKELDLLSSLGGPSYIRLNQSYVKKKKEIQKKIQHQHTTIMDKLDFDLSRRHGLPTKASI